MRPETVSWGQAWRTESYPGTTYDKRIEINSCELFHSRIIQNSQQVDTTWSSAEFTNGQIKEINICHAIISLIKLTENTNYNSLGRAFP